MYDLEKAKQRWVEANEKFHKLWRKFKNLYYADEILEGEEAIAFFRNVEKARQETVTTENKMLALMPIQKKGR